MSKTIEIRNVPESLHRELESRAASGGMTLSDFLLQELHELVQRPTEQEMVARLLAREGITPGVSVADILREDRDHR